MYGDLPFDRLSVKFLGPAPLDLEPLNMLTTFHWNALGSTLGWWFPTTCAKTGSCVERMNITCVNMVVLSSSISAKVSKMSCQEYTGYKWQCLTTQSPTQQHSEP